MCVCAGNPEVWGSADGKIEHRGEARRCSPGRPGPGWGERVGSFRLEETGSGNVGPGFRLVGYEWPARLHLLCTRMLVIQVISLPHGSTALRAAAVVWISPRPRSERIPRAVDQLRVTVVDGKRVLEGSFTFTEAAPVRKAMALINGLPASQPGVSSCPEDLGIGIRLAFYGGDAGRPLAVARVDPAGCEGVQLTVQGKPQPDLTSSAFPGSGRVGLRSLVAQLDRALDLQLETVPKS